MTKCFVLCVFIVVFGFALSQKNIVCYYRSWAAYGEGNVAVRPEDIDPNLCTHLIYSFVGITEQGEISFDDRYLDLPDDGGLNAMGRLVNLKTANRNLKVLVAVGGWTAGSLGFSKVVNDAALRQKFVTNALTFLQQHKFDGLDLDWEFPTMRGGLPTDKENFVKLTQELYTKLNGKKLLLTAAMAAEQNQVDMSYDLPLLSKYLHFINVMTYDYALETDKQIGHNAPLYPSSRVQGFKATFSVNNTIAHFLMRGVPASKMNLGMPAYGRSFTLEDPTKTYPGAPAKDVGIDKGIPSYRDFCTLTDWKKEWDMEQQVPWAVKGDQWVGYDDPRSFMVKSNYIKAQGLAGGMVWAVDQDDAHNVCHGGKFPLVNAMKITLK